MKTDALSEDLRPIAARAPATHLVIGGVSNWASYGLLTALSLLKGKDFQPLLPSVDDAKHQLRCIVEAGAVDGITHLREETVDGMPFEATADVLRTLWTLVTDMSEPSLE